MLPTEDEYVCGMLRLEKLLRAYLHRFAPQRADLEDLLQETYSRLFGLPHARRAQVNNLRAFAVTTARNVATDWIRHRQIISIEQIEDLSTLHIADEATGLDDIVHTHQQLLRIAAGIADLPARCRQVFTLRRVYGLTQKEIAKQLGITEGTVEQHLVKGMRRCAQIVDACDGVAEERGRDRAWFARWRRLRMQKGPG